MTNSTITKLNNYPTKTINRAIIALSCSPFKLNLFNSMIDRSIPLQNIEGTVGVEKKYSKKALSQTQTESYLVWLIKVGLLRREVDGQGLTDSFRVTPLGRAILEKYQKQGEFPQPSWKDKIYNWVNRWLP